MAELKDNVLQKTDEKSNDNCVYFVKTISHRYVTTKDWFYDSYVQCPRGSSEGLGILTDTGDFYSKNVMTSGTDSKRYKTGDFCRGGMEGKRVTVLSVLENGNFREPTEEEQEGEDLKVPHNPSFKEKIKKLQGLFKNLELPKELKEFKSMIDSIMEVDVTKY